MDVVHISGAPSGWNIAVGEHGFQLWLSDAMSYTLGDVFTSFRGIFGENIFSNHPDLLVLNDQDTPYCNAPAKQVFLNTDGNFPQQHIYQFSHELCHYIINKPVCDDYRWLEETFCELMSWCSLAWIYEHIRDHSSVYDSIPQYIGMQVEKCIPLNGEDLSVFISKNLSVLTKDCYKRDINRTVVNALYPLFAPRKDLLRIVLHLPELQNGVSLGQALKTICLKADIPIDFMVHIVSLLTE